MKKLEFHRLTIEDQDQYKSHYEMSHTLITDLTFACRIAWDPVFQTEIAFCEDCCLMISNGGSFTDPHLLMPLGNPTRDKLDKILDFVDEEFAGRGWKLKVMCIEDAQKEMFSDLTDYTAELEYSESASDYVYDAEALRSLNGNVLHKKRNHVNRFLRLYSNYRYRTLQMSDKEECLSLVTDWCMTKGIDPFDVHESDYQMIEQLFLHFDRLGLRGGLIEIDGKVRAFSIGSKGNDNTAFMHFEKADANFDGIYAAINKLTLENEFPEVAFVNREEDMGIPGLKKSKQSYSPLLLRKKYKTWPIKKKN